MHDEYLVCSHIIPWHYPLHMSIHVHSCGRGMCDVALHVLWVWCGRGLCALWVWPVCIMGVACVNYGRGLCELWAWPVHLPPQVHRNA